MPVIAVAFSVIALASAGFIIAFRRWIKKLDNEVVDVA